MQKQTIQYLSIAAGILTVSGVVSFLVRFDYGPYLFAAGAVLLVFIHGKVARENNNNPDKNQRRVTRLSFITSLCLAPAAYLMFKSSNSWVVFVLIYALSLFYYSFRQK